MTENQTAQIRLMREQGLGYKAIALRLDVSRDAVRGFCRRNGLCGDREAVRKNCDRQREMNIICEHCGAVMKQPKGRGRKRKFCSDRCRAAWWKVNSVLHKQGEKTQTRQCPCCGTAFKSFASADRKYCSHKCYIEHRFGGKNNDCTN